LRQQSDVELEEAQPGGFLIEADSIVQPFHLPRFEHGSYEPFSSAGGQGSVVEGSNGGGVRLAGPSTSTATERDEVSDEIPLDLGGSGAGMRHLGDVNARASAAADADLGLEEHAHGRGDEGSDGDMEDIFPQASGSFNAVPMHTQNSGGALSASGGVPKSMLELAEERLKQATENSGKSTERDDYATRANGGVEKHASATNGQTLRPRGRATKISAQQQKPTRASKRKPAKRKRDTSSASEPEMSAEPEIFDNFEAGRGQENEDDASGGRARRTKANTTRRTTRPKGPAKSSPAPTPPTRVLRTRAPKSPEKLRAEEEAEAALREAIEA
jgi:xeroderma pigmentosum group C-complementing protein